MRSGIGLRSCGRAAGAAAALPLAAVALCLLQVGCGTGGSVGNTSNVKSVNVYVATPGVADQITLYAGSLFLGASIPFGTVGSSGFYVPITSGTYNLVASEPGLQVAQLPSETFAGNNALYTVVAAGQAGQSGTLVPQIIVMPDYTANQITLSNGTAAIRVVNLSLNPNPIGLYSTSAGTPTTALGTFGSVAYGYNSATNGYSAVATSALVNMALVDTTATNKALTLSGTSNLNSIAITAGGAYTLIIYGQEGNATYPLGCTWMANILGQ